MSKKLFGTGISLLLSLLLPFPAAGQDSGGDRAGPIAAAPDSIKAVEELVESGAIAAFRIQADGSTVREEEAPLIYTLKERPANIGNRSIPGRIITRGMDVPDGEAIKMTLLVRPETIRSEISGADLNMYLRAEYAIQNNREELNSLEDLCRNIIADQSTLYSQQNAASVAGRLAQIANAERARVTRTFNAMLDELSPQGRESVLSIVNSVRRGMSTNDEDFLYSSRNDSQGFIDRQIKHCNELGVVR